jgi:hypothetical protein
MLNNTPENIIACITYYNSRDCTQKEAADKFKIKLSTFRYHFKDASNIKKFSGLHGGGISDLGLHVTVKKKQKINEFLDKELGHSSSIASLGGGKTKMNINNNNSNYSSPVPVSMSEINKKLGF